MNLLKLHASPKRAKTFQCLATLHLAMSFALVVGLTSSRLARAEGGMNSGGGMGVVCFKESAEAQSAEKLILAGKTLPNDLLQRASIQLLETWEMQQSKEAPLRTLKSKNYKDVLKVFDKYFAQPFPLFAERLEDLGPSLELDQWIDVGDRTLEYLGDATPIKPIPENCKLLQLVVRKQKNTNAMERGPISNEIEVSLNYSKAYFSRLNTFDQAALVLHEKIYSLGKAIGHNKSDVTRAIVRAIVSRKWQKDVANTPAHLLSPLQHSLHFSLVKYFGDYPIFFSKRERKSAAEFSPQHQQYAFIDSLSLLRGQIQECTEVPQAGEAILERYWEYVFENKKYELQSDDKDEAVATTEAQSFVQAQKEKLTDSDKKELLFKLCRDQGMNPTILKKTYEQFSNSNEMTFLHLAYFEEQVRGFIEFSGVEPNKFAFNAGALMSDRVPRIVFVKAMNFACRNIGHGIIDTDLMDMYAKKEAYCEAWRKATGIKDDGDTKYDLNSKASKTVDESGVDFGIPNFNIPEINEK